MEATDITLIDLHLTDDCGPILVANANSNTWPTATGNTRSVLGMTLSSHARTHYAAAGCADPTDLGWAHNQFAAISIPKGSTATIHCFVPVSDSSGNLGGADADAIANGGPNAVDPAGGWVNALHSYDETNGIRRQHYTKEATGSVVLYHATANNWGYIYMVELHWTLRPPSLEVIDLHTEGGGCGPTMVAAPTVTHNSRS